MNYETALNTLDDFTKESFSRTLSGKWVTVVDFASAEFYQSDESYSQMNLATMISEVAADILNKLAASLDCLSEEPDFYETGDSKIKSPSEFALGIKAFLSQFCEQLRDGTFAPFTPEIALCSVKAAAPFCPHSSLENESKWSDTWQDRYSEHEQYPFFSHTYFSPTRLNTIAMDPQGAMIFDCMKNDWAKYFTQFNII